VKVLPSIREQIQTVAERWEQAYFSNGEWFAYGKDKAAIYNKLESLPADATADDVAAVIGNDTWAGPHQCHECGESSLLVAQVGQPPDYESHTADICLPCARKVVALLESEVKP
jgi:hypothetical protein